MMGYYGASHYVATSTWTPASISGLDLWLAADEITGLSDGDPVTSWADLSSAGNDATESTYPPTYRAGVLNGLPVVEFDATNDRLGTNCSGSGAEQTIIMVQYRNAQNAYQSLMVAGARSKTGGLQYRWNSNKQQFLKLDIAAIALSTTAFGSGAWKILGMTYSDSGNSWAFRYQGAADGSGSTTQSLTAGRNFYIGLNVVAGGIQPMNGKVAEVLHYSAALSATDLGLIEAYLADKYAIAI